MRLTIPYAVLQEMRKKSKHIAFAQNGNEWGGNGRELESARLEIGSEDWKRLKELAAKPPKDLKDDTRSMRTYNKLLRNLIAIEKVSTASDDTVYKKLQPLAEAMVVFAKAKMPHGWIFVDHAGDNMQCPVVLTGITYHPYSSRGEVPAHIDVNYEWYERGKKESSAHEIKRCHIHGGVTAVQALSMIGTIETAELVAEHAEEAKLYYLYSSQLGNQFLAIGHGAISGEDSWNRKFVRFDAEGSPAKVIMDDDREEADESTTIEQALMCAEDDLDNDDMDSDEVGDMRKLIQLPLHPYVQVFDLKQHAFATVHIANITPYKYDATCADKLVLPNDTKALIDVLLGAASETCDDIIAGKKGGTIILCSGSPGTGKTLTAEVYSEAAQRPLYIVQCSQLGITPELLEKELALVLTRATRWNVILLIDEADVYIHERGNDMMQNAVVGVFLRLLEYFSGVLFLTTNRATIVDDAIVSRMLAHVRYKLPETKAQKFKLWSVLAKQFGIEMDAVTIDSAIDAFPKLSGRSIKQLLRLSKIIALRNKEPITIKGMQWITQFQDFAETEKE